MDNTENQSERTFLHEIAGPISILKLVIVRLMRNADARREIASDASPSATEDVTKEVSDKELFLRALKQIERLELLHAQHKSDITISPKTPTNSNTKSS